MPLGIPSEHSLLPQASLGKRCSSSILMDKVVPLPKEQLSIIDLSMRLPTVLRLILLLTYMQDGTVIVTLLKGISKLVMTKR